MRGGREGRTGRWRGVESRRGSGERARRCLRSALSASWRNGLSDPCPWSLRISARLLDGELDSRAPSDPDKVSATHVRRNPLPPPTQLLHPRTQHFPKPYNPSRRADPFRPQPSKVVARLRSSEPDRARLALVVVRAWEEEERGGRVGFGGGEGGEGEEGGEGGEFGRRSR